MKIDKVSFTGSVGVGHKIQEAATASNMKRVTLELGGKSPAIVFDDTDMATAVEMLSRGVTMNAGQVCVASSRVYVQESIAEELITGIQKNFEQLAKNLGGDPLDINTAFGPVVDKAQLERVTKFIEQGKSEATLVCGGQKYTGKGNYITPTLFRDPSKNASIYKEEIFGPVLVVKPFKTEGEAIELANDTHFGLAGKHFSPLCSHNG
jgi:aldehyde dehydrogenase (NAD+)